MGILLLWRAVLLLLLMLLDIIMPPMVQNDDVDDAFSLIFVLVLEQLLGRNLFAFRCWLVKDAEK